MSNTKKHIALDNQEITYTLRKRHRTRRISLAVHTDGSVVVTTPLNLSELFAERFIREKSNWLISKIAFFKQHRSQKISLDTAGGYAKHKDAARRLAIERIEHFNHVYGFTFNRISIRNQKTRWGSCSKKGNMNFNYKIVLLPKNLADYIIVHELCHLQEFNHSRKF